MGRIFIYTPIFRDDANLDGISVYAFSDDHAMKELLKYFNKSDIVGVEILGNTSTDDQDYLDTLS